MDSRLRGNDDEGERRACPTGPMNRGHTAGSQLDSGSEPVRTDSRSQVPGPCSRACLDEAARERVWRSRVRKRRVHPGRCAIVAV